MFGESRVVGGGRLVERVVLVVDVVGGQQPGRVPVFDRVDVHAEPVRGLVRGQQAACAETVVAGGEPAAGAEAPDDRGGERLAFERALALVVEDLGDLAFGVVLEQAVDLLDQLGRGAPELCDGGRERQGERVGL